MAYHYFIFNPSSIKNPRCYIRCDVAHTIKLVTTWKCLKGKSRRIREFYIRAVGQMIIAEDIENLRKTLYSIFVIALSEPEGNNIHNPKEITQCEIAKSWLKEKFAFGNLNIDFSENQPEKENDKIEELLYDIDYFIDSQSANNKFAQ
ncbi:unnamed protein product [Gordionus sp. m RMFG-2023]